MKQYFIPVLSILLLTACTVKRTPMPVSGSKADGTVKLAYNIGGFSKAKINWNSARRKALTRCESWGYKGVQKFGGVQVNCLARNGYGACMKQRNTITYQCMKEPSTPNIGTPVTELDKKQGKKALENEMQ